MTAQVQDISTVLAGSATGRRILQEHAAEKAKSLLSQRRGFAEQLEKLRLPDERIPALQENLTEINSRIEKLTAELRAEQQKAQLVHVQMQNLSTSRDRTEVSLRHGLRQTAPAVIGEFLNELRQVESYWMNSTVYAKAKAALETIRSAIPQVEQLMFVAISQEETEDRIEAIRATIPGM